MSAWPASSIRRGVAPRRFAPWSYIPYATVVAGIDAYNLLIFLITSGIIIYYFVYS